MNTDKHPFPFKTATNKSERKLNKSKYSIMRRLSQHTQVSVISFPGDLKMNLSWHLKANLNSPKVFNLVLVKRGGGSREVGGLTGVGVGDDHLSIKFSRKI